MISDVVLGIVGNRVCLYEKAMKGYGFDSLCTIVKVIQQLVSIVKKYTRNKSQPDLQNCYREETLTEFLGTRNRASGQRARSVRQSVNNLWNGRTGWSGLSRSSKSE